MNQILEKLPAALLPWFSENKRDLPWRHDREPYHIWLSEIMLQQTRVEAVKGYYLRFLEEVPSIEALSQIEDDKLHKLWEGLGYYSRVRNLKKAAQTVVERYQGHFPNRYEDVLGLSGIGEYTAGAICSIAFNQRKAAVDGNVLRVISRLTENDTPIDSPAYKKQVKQQLEAVYPTQAGDFTQALMELGATICGPNWTPRCKECPCREFCGSALHGTAERYPVKSPKAPRRTEYKTVFILSCGDCYALQKRPNTGLLAGLWQFPDVSGQLEPEHALQVVKDMGLRPTEIYRQVDRKHIFTHIQSQMRGFYMEVAEPTGDLIWFSRENIYNQAALPTAYRQFWEEIKNV